MRTSGVSAEEVGHGVRHRLLSSTGNRRLHLDHVAVDALDVGHLHLGPFVPMNLSATPTLSVKKPLVKLSYQSLL